ncbi:MAG: PD-(D/E)XK nuclease family protein [Phycisphaeraceae bacterium]
MPIARHFLGWDEPGLVRAVAWLRARFGREGVLDLGEVMIVVPARRAGRRLLELLAMGADDLVLIPPRIVTQGELPEQLYKPKGKVAGDLLALLARAHGLRRADPEVLRVVVHDPPGPGAGAEDLSGWLALAQDLGRLDAELAGQGVAVGQVAQRCAAEMDFTDQPRWEALGQLQALYEATLAQVGYITRDAARRAAVEGQCCAIPGGLGASGGPREIVLLATLDLNRVTRDMLMQVSEGATQITALVQAPESAAAGFDDMGCLNVEHWHEARLNIPMERVRIADRPRDQAYEVLRCLEEITADQGPTPGRAKGKAEARSSKSEIRIQSKIPNSKSEICVAHGLELAADQITVGMGDEAQAPMVQRTLELAGVPARAAVGRRLALSRPALFLASWARWLASDRFDDFAALLRHPDVEAYLATTLAEADDGVHDWLSLLDCYVSEHLQGRLAHHWLGESKRQARLKGVHDALAALAPADHARGRPLPQWSQAIADALGRLYGGEPLRRGDEQEAQIIRALELIGQVLREQAALEPSSPIVPEVTLAQAVNVALSQLAEVELPRQGGPPAVELLGWLELHLDDAPVLIVTGVNEGAIPQSVNADAFLPDHVRRVLGLTDNRHRYARDMAMLTAMLHSREHVRLITGRRGAEGDPLVPSRLLLACEDAELPQRMQRFYGEHAGEAQRQAPLLLEPGDDRFVIPLPSCRSPLVKLRVTAFRDYLACPYRFYLRHVCRLEALDDRAVEMDGLAFGNLAHSVLEAFGHSDVAASPDEQAIAHALQSMLEEARQRQYGGNPPAAVLIQCEQLRERLDRLARWQAQQNREGWRIGRQGVERDLSAVLEVDGEPFTITGRIDRVDVHEVHGHRILDYKTGDTAMTPEQRHRTGSKHAKRWVDLQLPLYTLLAASAGMAGPFGLGYVQLPKDLGREVLDEAPWGEEEVASAIEEARRIIRLIRRGVFWPPTEAVADEFAALCMDEALDRAQRIAAQTRGLVSAAAREGEP